MPGNVQPGEKKFFLLKIPRQETVHLKFLFDNFLHLLYTIDRSILPP